MKLFLQEVKDMKELREALKDNSEISKDYEVAVIVYAFDSENKEQNWIYLLYKGNFNGGELKIAEPNKCLGYEMYKIGEVDENELSNGAKELYRIVSEKYSHLK